MHSLTAVSVLLLIGDVCGRVVQAPTPILTPAPVQASVGIEKRQGPDAVSLAKVLLTAIPQSLREVAATNLPAVSSILWEEFLDDKKPWWFLELPPDIQSYLIQQFGPSTAIPTPTAPAWSSAEVTSPSVPAETSAAEETDSSVGTESTYSTGLEATQSDSASLSSQTTFVQSSRSSAETSTVSPSDSAATKSSASSTSNPTAPPAPGAESEDDGESSHSGLSRQQKIGVGVGVPLALLGVAALAFGCCFLRRRRRNKSVNGSVPPSSPGFIPRFAFQEKSYENLDQHDPLTQSSDSSGLDLRGSAWDDDVVEPAYTAPRANPPMQQTPVMAPALFHTHSSNRARGKRTSYQSLHSVPEVNETDEAESPVLPRHNPIAFSPLRKGSSSQSPPRNLIPPPAAVAATATATVAPRIKRKPVASYPNGTTTANPTADLASQSLLRQTMPDAYSSTPPRLGNHTEVTSSSPYSPISTSTPVSPIEERHSNNHNRRTSDPFSNNYSYVEDYGPEFNDPYIDIENGLYGGNTSFSRYPEAKKPSRTEWPLRNTIGRSHRRNKSPLWDRVYES